MTASALESKFKCWVPGGRNHIKMSKAVEDFREKHPQKNNAFEVLGYLIRAFISSFSDFARQQTSRLFDCPLSLRSLKP